MELREQALLTNNIYEQEQREREKREKEMGDDQQN